MEHEEIVCSRDYHHTAKPDLLRGKGRLLRIRVSYRCRIHAVANTSGGEARRWRCIHRSQGVTDIESEIIRRPTEEHHQSDQTQGDATHR